MIANKSNKRRKCEHSVDFIEVEPGKSESE